MNDEIWIARYEQLNERSRWYTSQLWYVPLAYMALVGFGVETVMDLKVPVVRGTALLLLALLSFGTFVHISSVKYYERRAVRALQQLEQEGGVITSSSLSPWYLSFSTYLRVVPLIACSAFVWLATDTAVVAASLQTYVRWPAVVTLALMTLTVLAADFKRNRRLRESPPFAPETNETTLTGANAITPELPATRNATVTSNEADFAHVPASGFRPDAPG